MPGRPLATARPRRSMRSYSKCRSSLLNIWTAENLCSTLEGDKGDTPFEVYSSRIGFIEDATIRDGSGTACLCRCVLYNTRNARIISEIARMSACAGVTRALARAGDNERAAKYKRCPPATGLHAHLSAVANYFLKTKTLNLVLNVRRTFASVHDS
ncbi:hypothetical protein EVAR_11397_1 [Eumeta japonica]|uniref:Uncharacterized protein n=1 Tax=Eumeta variegata TaxID=151549 RepID=A0A4C1TMZ7_EUMVA|nr:hypothetical protein EVAR_11397_1 [Eumeta japonica]